MKKLYKEFADGSRVVIKATQDPDEQELFGHRRQPGIMIGVISGNIIDISKYKIVDESRNLTSDSLTGLLSKEILECL